MSRKPALSEAEGDLRLSFKEHLGLHTGVLSLKFAIKQGLSPNKGCHPERTGPQALFSLGVVSRKPALSEAEGDLQLFFKEHLEHHAGHKDAAPRWSAQAIRPFRRCVQLDGNSPARAGLLPTAAIRRKSAFPEPDAPERDSP